MRRTLIAGLVVLPLASEERRRAVRAAVDMCEPNQKERCHIPWASSGFWSMLECTRPAVSTTGREERDMMVANAENPAGQSLLAGLFGDAIL